MTSYELSKEDVMLKLNEREYSKGKPVLTSDNHLQSQKSLLLFSLSCNRGDAFALHQLLTALIQ
jgi:hypothetical protein